MGRAGVSYSAIEKVAFELKASGRNPTVDAVREKLGTGSRSTIGPYLKRWRNQMEGSHQAPELPPELYALTKGLYQHLKEKAYANMVLQKQTDWFENKGKIMELQETITTQNFLIEHLENRHREVVKELEKMRAKLRESKNTVLYL